MEQELEMTATSILSLFETSKAERSSFVADVVQRLRDGEADPLKVHLQIKCAEDIINSLTCTDEKKNKNFASAIDYKNMLVAAAEKNGKKFTYHNAEFSIKEVGTSYDWSKCEDPELVDLLEQQKAITEKVKAKQEFLKNVPATGIEMRFNDELVTVYPPAKSSSTSVAVSLK